MNFEWIRIFDIVVFLHDNHREYSCVDQVLDAIRYCVDRVLPFLVGASRCLDVHTVKWHRQIAQRQKLIRRQCLGNSNQMVDRSSCVLDAPEASCMFTAQIFHLIEATEREKIKSNFKYKTLESILLSDRKWFVNNSQSIRATMIESIFTSFKWEIWFTFDWASITLTGPTNQRSDHKNLHSGLLWCWCHEKTTLGKQCIRLDSFHWTSSKWHAIWLSHVYVCATMSNATLEQKLIAQRRETRAHERKGENTREEKAQEMFNCFQSDSGRMHTAKCDEKAKYLNNRFCFVALSLAHAQSLPTNGYHAMAPKNTTINNNNSNKRNTQNNSTIKIPVAIVIATSNHHWNMNNVIIDDLIQSQNENQSKINFDCLVWHRTQWTVASCVCCYDTNHSLSSTSSIFGSNKFRKVFFPFFYFISIFLSKIHYWLVVTRDLPLCYWWRQKYQNFFFFLFRSVW